MAKINEIEGRIAPQATRVIRGSDQFGDLVERPAMLSPAPVSAFGDAEGQLAVANALQNVGTQLFDIAIREQRMRQAEEDTRLERMLTDYNYEEGLIRQQLEEEQVETYRNADQKYEEYQKRLDSARSRIRGDYEFKTYTSEAIETRFGDITRTRDVEYRAGQLERDRRDGIVADATETLNKYANQAAIAGKDNAPHHFAASVQSIRDLTSSPRFIAAVGGAAKAKEVEQSMIERAVIGFVRETAERNPQDALALIDADDSLLVQVLSESDLNIIREDLQDVVKREQLEKDQAFEKEQETLYGDLMLGIRDVRSTTGKPTTRYEIKNSNLTDIRKAQLLNAYDAEQNERRNAQQKATEVSILLETGGTLIADPEGQDKVDKWFTARWNQLANVDPMIRMERINKEVAQLGVVPTTLKNMLEGHLMTGNDQVALQAAVHINALKDHNPNLKYSDNAEYLALLVGSGVSVTEARIRVNEIQKITPQERKMILDHLDTKTETIIDLLDDIDLETDDPTAISEFTRLFQQNFVRMKNKDLALKQTEREMKVRWGETRIGGIKKVVRFPPEMFHGKLAEEDFKGLLREKNLNPREFTIVHKAGTSKENLEYFIIRLDGMPLLNDNYTPVIWRPDMKRGQQYALEFRQKLKEAQAKDTGIGVFIQ